MRRTFALALVLLPLLSACDIQIVPPPEAVLAGTWRLETSQDTTLTQTYLTFNDYGELSKIVYKIGSNATVTDNSPHATVSVDGLNVSITSQFAGNGLVINGTLNEAHTVITGQQGTEIHIAGLTISIDQGTVTLTKQ